MAALETIPQLLEAASPFRGGRGRLTVPGKIEKMGYKGVNTTELIVGRRLLEDYQING